ncbi:hypothetical protein ACIP5Y_47365 [Nocardia sp. NPDC088792]|uniref:hypothetical protein n=1 Tax=Nocardia sp. NPDC088792 TaxID=3364332 RepID=UPI00380A2123
MVVVALLIVASVVVEKSSTFKHQQAVTAKVGGSPGWPTPTWESDHKPLGLGPYHLNGGKNTVPVHGQVEVPGVDTTLPFVTYRSHTSQTQEGWTSRTTRTWTYTSIAIPALNSAIADMEVVSTAHTTAGDPVWKPMWEGISFADQLFPTGAGQFGEFYTVYSPRHRDVAAILTDRVRGSMLQLYKYGAAPRIRIKGGVLFAWVHQPHGTETRNTDQFQNLLSAAAILVFWLNAAAARPVDAGGR